MTHALTWQDDEIEDDEVIAPPLTRLHDLSEDKQSSGAGGGGGGGGTKKADLNTSDEFDF